MVYIYHANRKRLFCTYDTTTFISFQRIVLKGMRSNCGVLWTNWKSRKRWQGETGRKKAKTSLNYSVLDPWVIFVYTWINYWNMDAWKKMKETNKKKSMCFLWNHFVFKLNQNWVLLKVHDQNLISPLFQILGSRNREMFPHLYSSQPSLPGMQPQPQDPVRAIFYRTRVRSLAMLVTHSLTDSLTHSVTLSKLYWCDPGVWRCQLKTYWGCCCCWCWLWGACWQQFVADLEAEVWSYS